MDTATLRLLFLQQLLHLRVVQGARAGLDGYCVCLHAHMIPKKASPGAAQLLQVIPLNMIPRQEADSLYNLDLLLSVVTVRPTLFSIAQLIVHGWFWDCFNFHFLSGSSVGGVAVGQVPDSRIS